MRFPRRYKLVTLFIIISIVASLLGIVRVHMAQDREFLRIAAGNELRAQATVLLDYAHAFHGGMLPLANTLGPSGTPLYSWRFELIPYTESSDFSFLDFSKPWNAAPNTALLDVCPPRYCFQRFERPPKRSWTNVFAVVGPGTAFDRRNLEHVDSDTILLIETRNSRIHWMEPGDLNIESMPKTIGVDRGIGGVWGDGFHVAFADGEVWYLKNSVPFDLVVKFMTVRGAKEHGREHALAPYRIEGQ